ncbi:MAG: [FeFe] hydrogenase H-cluster maturation GTPase HydF [Kiritimatiellaeota bacterium]|nr:[FeFe] hydrogenase H-cluster maturation GTPase HydF [Kiritimatiellota bacterium]
MNTTPQSERVHIAVFGRRNVGKSSLINALTGQTVSIVSDVKGTTTDPVRKAMELLPLGPVLFIDTPGLDDEGPLGDLRIQRTYDMLNQTDIAIIVLDGGRVPSQAAGSSSPGDSIEQELLSRIREKQIPFVVVVNKSDLVQEASAVFDCTRLPSTAFARIPAPPFHAVSAVTGEGIAALKIALAHIMPDHMDTRLVGDLLAPGDTVVLVTPIDSAAPKGRLILPQQQVLRDILDAHAIAVVTQPSELQQTLAKLATPLRMVITDSQAFAEVAAATPPDVPLTSFSILFARYKGDLDTLADGTSAVANLKDGDRILMAEGCTHHRQTDDIGTVKIPRALLAKTGKALAFEHVSGIQYPKDLSRYALIVQCGACMLNRRETLSRIRQAKDAHIPITNYGILLAHLQGILPRCLNISHKGTKDTKDNMAFVSVVPSCEKKEKE